MKKYWIVPWLLATLGAGAQPLTLKEAVQLATGQNKSIEAAGAAAKAAETRVRGAASSGLPKVNYTESWTRSDNPVFVFGSLLTQHQFTSDNFQLGSLNEPNFVNNFQSLLTADQTVYDGGQTRRAVRSARLATQLASEDGRRTETEVVGAVIRAYYDAQLSAAQLKATSQAVKSAEADLERAQAIHSAGMSTDGDMLSIRVHLSALREQYIRRTADLEVARAALNDAIGINLDTPHELVTPLEPLKAALAVDEAAAIEARPEARQLKLAQTLAETQAASAKANLLPQVYLHGAFEADRQRFINRGGDNWLVSAGVRWNLFNGFADQSKIEETRLAVKRASAEAERAGSAIRLQVRRAHADLRAATERIEVAKATVMEAEESLRITQNRYQAGMSNVTDLLRTETALLEARTRQLAAVHDQRIAAAALEQASGSLTAASALLNEGN